MSAGETPFRLDANLLVALDALLRERNVTRAAAALGMGQPGMSHMLQRLREHFGDPLLVRSGSAYVLSPRASELAGPVRDTVAAMRRLLAVEDAFDPSTARREFRLAMTDGVGFVLLPLLLERLAAVAPAVSLHVRAVPDVSAEADLAAGQLDLAVTHFGALPPAIRRDPLWREEYVALVSAQAWPPRRRLTRAAYDDAAHVVVATKPTGTSALETMLRERGITRRVLAEVPHFLLTPHLVARTGAIATVARSLGARLAEELPVRVVPLPLELPPYEISQIWHVRSEHDPAHAWLRGEIAAVARAATAPRRRRR